MEEKNQAQTQEMCVSSTRCVYLTYIGYIYGSSQSLVIIKHNFDGLKHN